MPSGPFESYTIDGSRLTILRGDQDTVGAYCLIETVKQPGRSTLPHVHMLEWEAAYGIEGQLQIEAAGETVVLGPGDLWAFPPGVAHRLANVSEQSARYLTFHAPAGYDDFIREVGRPAGLDASIPLSTRSERERLLAAAPRHGITILPPEALLIRSARTPLVGATASQRLPGFGDDVVVLAELGPEPESPALLRLRLPAGASIPMHSHAQPELIYVTTGRLELFRGLPSSGTWRPLGVGAVAQVGGGQPHAFRNVHDTLAEAFVVTTRARLLVGRPGLLLPSFPTHPRSIH